MGTKIEKIRKQRHGKGKNKKNCYLCRDKNKTEMDKLHEPVASYASSSPSLQSIRQSIISRVEKEDDIEMLKLWSLRIDECCNRTRLEKIASECFDQQLQDEMLANNYYFKKPFPKDCVDSDDIDSIFAEGENSEIVAEEEVSKTFAAWEQL